MQQRAFSAKHKYQPAPIEAPTLAAFAPPPQQQNLVCSCSSNDQGVREGPVITFQYAGLPACGLLVYGAQVLHEEVSAEQKTV